MGERERGGGKGMGWGKRYHTLPHDTSVAKGLQKILNSNLPTNETINYPQKIKEQLHLRQNRLTNLKRTLNKHILMK